MNILITRNAAIHILKHAVAAREIRQAERDPARVVVRAGGAFYFVYARTHSGRLLAVLIERRPAGLFLKTARPMASWEKRLYRGKRKIRRHDETDEKEETA
ncbi:MAG: hypothetical protein A3G34_03155 [Candidatus Lindowbacteria bacterium RIFCSPLOWO2_12_FULL_62_27]|nr:MAG: hypothetical protein A3I06_08260 [Candidatus Lindowbacteria bacterium RIFCSPLOWO2_02_FULL_62_12]OGH59295.1 MAG: hypothetical protein A3G34_03155 [Candidatus Lindowbacteria bacterium RIFCSPLOWO2_12_FULL_62_27]